MAKKYVTNGDRILQAVLADEDLIRFGEYNPAEYNDLNIALYSNNLVVKTVAQIISGVNNGDNNKEIYTVVTNFLKIISNDNQKNCHNKFSQLLWGKHF